VDKVREKFKTQKGILDEIDAKKYTIEHSLDGYGAGHVNLLGAIPYYNREGITFLGKPIRQRLVKQCKQIDAAYHNLCLELDRASFERCDQVKEALSQTVYRGKPVYETGYSLIIYVLNEGLISRAEHDMWNKKWFALRETDFKERFLKIGKRVREVHEHYIAFLESCLAEDEKKNKT
jgi:hypothetical protein